MHVQMCFFVANCFVFFCRLNTLLHMILCACLVNFSFQPTKPAHNLTADVFNKTHIDKNWCLIWREPDFFHYFRFASYLPLCWKYMKMQRIKRHYAFFSPFHRNPLTTVLHLHQFFTQHIPVSLHITHFPPLVLIFFQLQYFPLSFSLHDRLWLSSEI